MTKITVYDSMDAPSTGGTSLKGKLPYGVVYQDLVEVLGEPTFLPDDSGDGKVNFEWVVEFENEFGIGPYQTIESELEFYVVEDKKANIDWYKLNY